MLSPISAHSLLFEGKRRREGSTSVASDEGPSQRRQRSASAEDSFGLVKSTEKPIAKRQRRTSESSRLTRSATGDAADYSKGADHPIKSIESPDIEMSDSEFDLNKQQSWNTDSSDASVPTSEGAPRPPLNTPPPPPLGAWMEFVPSISDEGRRPPTRGKKSHVNKFIRSNSFGIDSDEAHPSHLGLGQNLSRGRIRPSNIVGTRSYHLRQLEQRKVDDMSQLFPSLKDSIPGFNGVFDPNLVNSRPIVTTGSESYQRELPGPKEISLHPQDSETDIGEAIGPKPASRSPKNEPTSPDASVNQALKAALDGVKLTDPTPTSSKPHSPIVHKFNLVLR